MCARRVTRYGGNGAGVARAGREGTGDRMAVASDAGEDKHSGRTFLDGVGWNAGVRNRGRHGIPGSDRRLARAEIQPQLQGGLAAVRRYAVGRGISGVSARARTQADLNAARCGLLVWEDAGEEKKVQAVLDRRRKSRGGGRSRGAGTADRDHPGECDRNVRRRDASSRRCAGARGAKGAAGEAGPGIGGRFLRHGTDGSPTEARVRLGKRQ